MFSGIFFERRFRSLDPSKWVVLDGDIVLLGENSIFGKEKF